MKTITELFDFKGKVIIIPVRLERLVVKLPDF